MKIITITDSKYPKRLLDIKIPPKQLYVKGNEELLNNNSLAIVGSRKCTNYGRMYTKEFASETDWKSNDTLRKSPASMRDGDLSRRVRKEAVPGAKTKTKKQALSVASVLLPSSNLRISYHIY